MKKVLLFIILIFCNFLSFSQNTKSDFQKLELLDSLYNKAIEISDAYFDAENYSEPEKWQVLTGAEILNSTYVVAAYEKAIECAIEQNNRLYVLQYRLGLAEFYRDIKDYSKSMTHLVEAWREDSLFFFQQGKVRATYAYVDIFRDADLLIEVIEEVNPEAYEEIDSDLRTEFERIQEQEIIIRNGIMARRDAKMSALKRIPSLIFFLVLALMGFKLWHILKKKSKEKEEKRVAIFAWIVLALVILNWVLLFTIIPETGSYGTGGLNIVVGGFLLIITTILSVISVAIDKRVAKLVLGIISLVGLFFSLLAQLYI